MQHWVLFYIQGIFDTISSPTVKQLFIQDSPISIEFLYHEGLTGITKGLKRGDYFISYVSYFQENLLWILHQDEAKMHKLTTF